jgi:bifunctional DNA-binding transcriptional regulator/antitoxin component of YhaV-PrlF toxin-antitoxin module
MQKNRRKNMKLIETTATVDQKGRLAISQALRQKLELAPGIKIHVILSDTPNCLSEAWHRLIHKADSSESHSEEENGEEVSLVLPDELLGAANIPKGGSLNAVCVKGAIVITARDIINNLPDELRDLFDELGIDPGTVREVMEEEGYFS